MKSKTAILMSLGLSVALIAMGIWFLSGNHFIFGYGGRGWHMPHYRMMGFGGMGIFMILFWAAWCPPRHQRYRGPGYNFKAALCPRRDRQSPVRRHAP